MNHIQILWVKTNKQIMNNSNYITIGLVAIALLHAVCVDAAPETKEATVPEDTMPEAELAATHQEAQVVSKSRRRALPCKDKEDYNCPVYKSKNYCHYDNAKVHCPVTCGVCTPRTFGGRRRFVSSVDYRRRYNYRRRRRSSYRRRRYRL